MATIKGSSAPAFGISADLHSLITQKITSTQKCDKKEGRDKNGDVKCVAYYNNTTEISFDGLGDISLALAASITASVPTAGGTFFCEEVTRDYSNEDFVKSSVKGTAYPAIS